MRYETSFFPLIRWKIQHCFHFYCMLLVLNLFADHNTTDMLSPSSHSPSLIVFVCVPPWSKGRSLPGREEVTADNTAAVPVLPSQTHTCWRLQASTGAPRLRVLSWKKLSCLLVVTQTYDWESNYSKLLLLLTVLYIPSHCSLSFNEKWLDGFMTLLCLLRFTLSNHGQMLDCSAHCSQLWILQISLRTIIRAQHWPGTVFIPSWQNHCRTAWNSSLSSVHIIIYVLYIFNYLK